MDWLGRFFRNLTTPIVVALIIWFIFTHVRNECREKYQDNEMSLSECINR